jgi:hypothetical protein
MLQVIPRQQHKTVVRPRQCNWCIHNVNIVGGNSDAQPTSPERLSAALRMHVSVCRRGNYGAPAPRDVVEVVPIKGI